MKRSAYARAALAIGAIALACTSALAQTAQQPAKFRIQTAVPSASIYFELLKRFGDRVDRMSGGRIKMEMLPDGAIVPAFEILDAVDKGIVEGDNPTELSRRKTHSVKMDSRASVDNWRSKLSPDEINRIREITEDSAQLFYPDINW